MVPLYEHSTYRHWRNVHFFVGHSRTLRLACTWRFYNEVIPSSKYLLGDETSKSSVPRNCKYLLLAYHHLPEDLNGVMIFDWVGFWFKGPLRYAAPPLRSSRKRVHELKLSCNPSGDVNVSNLPRTKDHDEPFTILQILEDIRDETYVAAFLSCWLCSFVLPHNTVGKKEILTCSLKELGRFWQSCTLSGTSSKLLIPSSVSSSPLVTKEYADWWAKCNKTSLEKNTGIVLKLKKLPNLENESKDNQVIPAIETEVTRPVAATCKRRHNVLVDTSVIALSSENDMISALSISNGQLSNTQPLEKVFDLDTISVNSSFFEGVPSSFMPLNELVLYVRREVYEESLSLAKDDPFATEAKENEHVNEVESLEAEILQVVNQLGVLKKQLEEPQRKKEFINSSLHGAKGVLINFRKEVATKKEKTLMLENNSYCFEIERICRLWDQSSDFLVECPCHASLIALELLLSFKHFLIQRF
ncbi:UNVERIFIED_CONTAM: hypothetical protein Slati_4484500 [Sesamum latifolium]|uniref:Aminotransferase-like plant mobile domain-containing protein n=1 Tax=Sesamum latifolium TaxID=2727402 RepID=A0AAW2SRY0_9LAMI